MDNERFKYVFRKEEGDEIDASRREGARRMGNRKAC